MNLLFMLTDTQWFNRTFMELKQILRVTMPLPDRRFNRTFMELKLRSSRVVNTERGGLIVPLWN